LEIEIPEMVPLYNIIEKQLPKDWCKMEHFTQLIGYNAFKHQKYLGVKVPSASVIHECNYLMNPAHPEFHLVKITSAEPYTFDDRLFDSTVRVERKLIDRPSTKEELENYNYDDFGNVLS